MIDPLFEAPERFDFFQAVRLLERAAARAASSATATGRDNDPRQEALRFTSIPSRTYPTSSVGRMTRRPADGFVKEKVEIAVNFLGLTGPAGVLPHHYTSLLLARIRERDYVLRDFLDLFHHRTISLFYRAWEKYRFPFSYERSQYDPGTTDLFTRCLVSLTGCETIPPGQRSALADETFLYYTGLFASQHRSAVCLERMLNDFLGTPVVVQQFAGHWQTLAREDRTCLPAAGERGGGQFCRLGGDAFIGERIWDVQGRFRVRIGPVDYATFRDYLPTGSGLAPAVQLTRAYAGAEFDFEIQLLLHAREVPPCRLGSPTASGGRLGWDTWIWARPFDRTADDAVFNVADQFV